MEVYVGKAAFQGIAIGRIVELKKADNLVRREHIEDIEAEIARIAGASEKAGNQLGKLYEKAVKEVGEANAAIFEVHQMMLEDDDYIDSIHNIIRTQSVNAEYAVATTSDNFSSMFAAMDDDYMKARAADIKDVSERLIKALQNVESGGTALTEKSIIVADDLAPSETVQLDKDMVLAFVTRQGSTNSHTAILARTMNIPALVGVPMPADVHGKSAVVNGYESFIAIDPDEQTLDAAEQVLIEEAEKKKLLQEYKGKPTVTKSGRAMKLYANIGGVSDVAAVLQNDAAGIGLFRSEFLYLQEEDYPSEDKQFLAYRQVAEMMAGKPVIIRTLDIGADKQIDYFQLDKEENPALGYRAVRICLTREEIFRS